MKFAVGDRVVNDKYGAGVVTKIRWKSIFVKLDAPIQHKKYSEDVVKFLEHSLKPEKKKRK